MVNSVSWDEVRTLTEGLVTIAGWNGVQNESGLEAELLISKTKDYAISFAVAEHLKSLEFTVRLEVSLSKKVDEDKFDASLALITKTFWERKSSLQLEQGRLIADIANYGFAYRWQCDSELQQELTLPVLYGTIMRWSQSISAPIFVLAPLLGFYFRGVLKEDSDFVLEAHKSLDLIECSPGGRA